MMQTEGKKREIISQTVLLLSTADERMDITTRTIAKNAGVNPAMINYYFGSKDVLLKAAIASMKEQPVDPRSFNDGTRKAMFDHLMGVSETSALYAAFKINRDAASFSNDAFEASSKLLEMKKSHDNKTLNDDDPALIFKIICFLMMASADPEKYQKYSGIDIRVKNNLRMLVSKQLDALLGDIL